MRHDVACGPRRRFLFTLLVLLLFPPASGAVTLTDDSGREVVLPQPASGIVTLAPHLSELAFVAGAGAKLVGVAEYSDFPAEARRISRIGDAARVDVERLLALKPALVLAWLTGNPAANRESVRRLGIPMHVSEIRTFSDVARVIREIGRMAGTSSVAEAEAARFERDVATLRASRSGRKPVRVFYEIWHEPLLTVSGRHLISEAIGLCGGINVFAEAPLLTPAVSVESVLAARPDVIVGGGSASDATQFEGAWARHGVAALKAIPVRHLSPDTIQRQTPRVLEGAVALCRILDEVRGAMR